MTSDEILPLFTRSDGSYFFARWGRPIAPVVFGVQDSTLATMRAAFDALCTLAAHEMAETDAELGANVMVFFCRDWDEILGVPNLERLIDGLADLITRLKAAEANQYRVFRFDEQGAIKACFVLLRMDEHLSQVPADTLALSQVVHSMLVWSDAAFRDASPLALLSDGRAVLRPEIAGMIRAAYAPVMPAFSQDPSHALRLAARIGPLQ